MAFALEREAKNAQIIEQERSSKNMKVGTKMRNDKIEW